MLKVELILHLQVSEIKKKTPNFLLTEGWGKYVIVDLDLSGYLRKSARGGEKYGGNYF